MKMCISNVIYFDSSLSRYWYLGPLKTRAAHWFSSLKVSVVLHWQWSYFSYLHISENWINKTISSPTAVATESPGIPLLSGSCSSSTWPAHWNATPAEPPLPHLPQTPELLEPSYRRYFIIFTNISLYRI